MLLERAVCVIFLPLSPHCSQSLSLSPVVFHGAQAWQSPNATHCCFLQQENSWVYEWLSKKIAFYDLLVQLALLWRPATIVWTVCNEEGRRNKCLLLPLGLLGMHLPMLNVSEFISKNEMICLTVCILSSEFKAHSPLGCPDNAFIFACCLVFTLQGLLTVQMNSWDRYNILCTSPCLMCHLDSLCIDMPSRTTGNLLEMAQCSYTGLSEPVALFLVTSAFI